VRRVLTALFTLHHNTTLHVITDLKVYQSELKSLSSGRLIPRRLRHTQLPCSVPSYRTFASVVPSYRSMKPRLLLSRPKLPQPATSPLVPSPSYRSLRPRLLFPSQATTACICSTSLHAATASSCSQAVGDCRGLVISSACRVSSLEKVSIVDVILSLPFEEVDGQTGMLVRIRPAKLMATMGSPARMHNAH
jgi:hypothetical protein